MVKETQEEVVVSDGNGVSELDRFKAELKKVKESTDLDEATRQLYVSALDAKIAATQRANDAKAERIKTKLFIEHFFNGCPQCQHTYRASDGEVQNALRFKEMSSMKL